MLKLYGELANTADFRDGVALNGKLYVGDANNNILSYDLASNGMDYSRSLTINPSGVTLLTTASGCAVSNAVTTVDIIELSTGYSTNLSGGATCFAQTRGQNVAGNTDAQIAIASSNTVNQVVKITPTAVSTVSVSLGGAKASCIVNLSSSLWLVGTNDGKVHEINDSGTISKTITLPNNSAGTPPTIIVTGLAYYNDRLAVATKIGTGFIYTYSTSTVLEKFFTKGSTSGSSLCPSPNGAFLYGSNGTNAACNGVVECFLKPFRAVDTYTLGDVAMVHSTGIDESTGKAWVIQQAKIHIFDIGLKTTSTVQTRAIDGSDVAARILRIRVPRKGQAYIDSDQNISPGAANIEAVKDSEYIEVAIVSGTPDRYDIRRFST